MIVMPTNNTKWQVHYWQGKYGGLGHMYSPGGERGPYAHLPYALDNGAFPCWQNEVDWSEDAFLNLCQWAVDASIKPRWVATPDVVADAEATLELWPHWSRTIMEMGLTPALVTQDGMSIEDMLATKAKVLFVGGSTEWKWLWLHRICEAHPRVHVGRVNGYKPLLQCYRAGAESCDGTGWFRGDKRQIRGLERFLDEQFRGALPHDVGLFKEEN